MFPSLPRVSSDLGCGNKRVFTDEWHVLVYVRDGLDRDGEADLVLRAGHGAAREVNAQRALVDFTLPGAIAARPDVLRRFPQIVDVPFADPAPQRRLHGDVVALAVAVRVVLPVEGELGRPVPQPHVARQMQKSVEPIDLAVFCLPAVGGRPDPGRAQQVLELPRIAGARATPDERNE